MTGRKGIRDVKDLLNQMLGEADTSVRRSSPQCGDQGFQAGKIGCQSVQLPGCPALNMDAMGVGTREFSYQVCSALIAVCQGRGCQSVQLQVCPAPHVGVSALSL